MFHVVSFLWKRRHFLVIATFIFGRPPGSLSHPRRRTRRSRYRAQLLLQLAQLARLLGDRYEMLLLNRIVLDELIAYASGEKTTKAVLQGRDDFLPWKRGMSL